MTCVYPGIQIFCRKEVALPLIVGATDNHQCHCFQIGEAHPNVHRSCCRFFVDGRMNTVRLRYLRLKGKPLWSSPPDGRADLDPAMPFGRIACSG